MPPEHWRQIEAIFHAALEREPGVRQAYLEQVCGGDEVLRRQVDALLDQDAHDGELLSQPIEKVADEVLAGGPSQLRFDSGSMAGPYRIGERLGAGGMGEVYRAQDTRLNRTVAIKTLKARFTQRFEREARAISALNHPHICTLYDIGSQDGIGYLVMEYVEGQPLKGPLPLKEALRLAIQIAGALEAAHEKGILHRDLKPGNILVSKGNVKLLDFGLAKFVRTETRPAEATVTAPLTGAGQILGTLAYMAPEQIEGKPADARSDIFSFGLVLYEMLTGRQTFEASSQAGLMAAILKEEPRPLTSLQPLIPPALERTVAKCLAKEPARRWQTAADLRDELAWIAERDEVAAGTVPRRAILPWIAAAGVAGAGIGGLATSAWIGRSSRRPAEAIKYRLAAPEGTWMQHVLNRQSGAVSPVGSSVAMVAIGDRGPLVWVQGLDQRTARPLAGTDGATMVFWSHDGRFIGFWAGEKLRKIPVGGGTPVPICDLPEPWSASWNKDGAIVAAGGLGRPAWIIEVDSGTTTRWKPVLMPRFLPDGKHLLYLSQDPKIESYRAYVEEYSTGRQTPLMPTDTQVVFAPDQQGTSQGYLIYGRASTLLAQRFDAGERRISGVPVPVAEDVQFFRRSGWSDFDASPGILISSAAAPKTQLIWVDRRGHNSGNLGDPQDYWTFFRLSPDGKRLAYDVFDNGKGSTDIWVYDISKNTAERVTSNPGLEVSPVWSPDGTRLAFGGGPGNVPPQLKMMALVERGAWESFSPGDYQVPADWSSDGRWITYGSFNDELWVASVADRKIRPLLQTPFSTQHGVFSPNGEHMAFATDENGRLEIYVQRFEGGDSPKLTGPRQRVSQGGGRYPMWRRDGKELFFVSPDRKIMAVAVRRGAVIEFDPPTALFRLPQSFNPVSPDGGSFDVTANGQKFLVITGSVVSPPLQVVVNWQAGLNG
jgi:Tol biopolymer transport system component/predicted Ser/Thr protein kinase